LLLIDRFHAECVGFTKKDLDDLTKSEREYICARCRVLPDDFDVLHEKKKSKTKHVTVNVTATPLSAPSTVLNVPPTKPALFSEPSNINVLSHSSSVLGEEKESAPIETMLVENEQPPQQHSQQSPHVPKISLATHSAATATHSNETQQPDQSQQQTPSPRKIAVEESTPDASLSHPDDYSHVPAIEMEQEAILDVTTSDAPVSSMDVEESTSNIHI
jgi:hypothetical protein